MILLLLTSARFAVYAYTLTQTNPSFWSSYLLFAVCLELANIGLALDEGFRSLRKQREGLKNG